MLKFLICVINYRESSFLFVSRSLLLFLSSPLLPYFVAAGILISVFGEISYIRLLPCENVPTEKSIGKLEQIVLHEV